MQSLLITSWKKQVSVKKIRRNRYQQAKARFVSFYQQKKMEIETVVNHTGFTFTQSLKQNNEHYYRL